MSAHQPDLDHRQWTGVPLVPVGPDTRHQTIRQVANQLMNAHEIWVKHLAAPHANADPASCDACWMGYALGWYRPASAWKAGSGEPQD